MEELRIKCPSCGIVLDVRNSKNEAVKQIVCPNCKKHLAVTFREDAQPAQFVDIKKVQLADGTIKTIVRALSDDHVVKINGVQLQKGDEVVLAPGDELQIDAETAKVATPQSASAAPVPPSTPVRHASSPRWPLYIGLVALAVLLLWLFIPRQQESLPAQVVTSDSVETTVSKPASGKKHVSPTKRDANRRELRAPAKQSSRPHMTSLSNYDLEQLAISGDVEAQYQLGKRWVSRRDSSNVVKGIKYLKLAARNGSSEATRALRTVYTALQQSAVQGSSTAENILREQQ